MKVLRRCVREVLGLLLLLGCAPGPDGTGPIDSGRAFAPSGFLGDYSELRAGSGTQARLGYLDTAVDFSGYTQVVVEPAVVWKSNEARFAGVPQTQREMLARELEAEMRRAFGEEFLAARSEHSPRSNGVDCGNRSIGELRSEIAPVRGGRTRASRCGHERAAGGGGGFEGMDRLVRAQR